MNTLTADVEDFVPVLSVLDISKQLVYQAVYYTHLHVKDVRDDKARVYTEQRNGLHATFSNEAVVPSYLRENGEEEGH